MEEKYYEPYNGPIKIYLAGKIDGDPDYREKFNEVREYYEDSCDIVLNPADLPEGMEPEDYMAICFTMIHRADLVVFLPDWPESRGASIEHDYCLYIGKKIVHLSKGGEAVE